ncbi:MAG: hypothetical protein GTO16_06590 [Candidatus Aminicenantes bacterium]|nr:hypothetical protein [Candidatus Aminicenantes bacterium]
MKKIITIIFSFMLFVSFLCSQSVVELAKKEKERRAKLKGKRAVVVTNDDLRSLGRTAAVEIIEPAFNEDMLSLPEEEIEPENIEEQARLEADWKKASERASLLTLRMNELQQRFFSFENQYDRAEMQREIFETFQKLQVANQNAEAAKTELDKEQKKRRK